MTPLVVSSPMTTTRSPPSASSKRKRKRKKKKHISDNGSENDAAVISSPASPQHKEHQPQKQQQLQSGDGNVSKHKKKKNKRKRKKNRAISFDSVISTDDERDKEASAENIPSKEEQRETKTEEKEIQSQPVPHTTPDDRKQPLLQKETGSSEFLTPPTDESKALNNDNEKKANCYYHRVEFVYPKQEDHAHYKTFLFSRQPTGQKDDDESKQDFVEDEEINLKKKQKISNESIDDILYSKHKKKEHKKIDNDNHTKKVKEESDDKELLPRKEKKLKEEKKGDEKKNDMPQSGDTSIEKEIVEDTLEVSKNDAKEDEKEDDIKRIQKSQQVGATEKKESKKDKEKEEKKNDVTSEDSTVKKKKATKDDATMKQKEKSKKHYQDDGEDNKGEQEILMQQQDKKAKLSGLSVQDAVNDSYGRRPRANSTDHELNLPRRGLCDEHLVLQNHKWNSISGGLRPRGYINLGNTCFLNATLQCLVYLPTFSQCVGNLKVSSSGKSKILTILRNLIRKSHNGIYSDGGETKAGPIAPKEMMKVLQKLGSSSMSSKGHHHRRLFRPGRQEDAHEFLVHLLDSIHTSELQSAGINQNQSGWRDRLPIPRLDETTLIHRIFGGYFRSQVCCTKCPYKSNTYDPFLDLSLEVSSGKLNSIKSAFAEFTKKEHLDIENKWKCSGCQRRVCAVKQLTVFRPPLSLCIQLKRFAFGSGGFGGFGGDYGGFKGYGGFGGKKGRNVSMMMGRGSSKISKPIEFPATLKLPLSDGRTCEYVLMGAIIHVGGSATSGHYTAYVKKPSSSSDKKHSQWYHMDDSFVDPVSEKTVLKQKDAYVLFYCRREVKLEFPSPPTPISSKKVKRKSMTTEEAKKVARARADSITSLNSVASSLHNNDSDSESSASNNVTIAAEKTKKTAQCSKKKKDENATAKRVASTSPETEKKGVATTSIVTSARSTAIENSRTNTPVKKEEKGKKLVQLQRGTQEGNIQVVVGHHRKEKTSAWTPSHSTSTFDHNKDEKSDLLGNINVGKWDDDDDDRQHQKNQRHSVLKDMQSKERARKRKMYLTSWDAKLDEGKRKKVKTKSPSNTFNATNQAPEFNPFHRIQSSMQKMNKGRAKGFHHGEHNHSSKNKKQNHRDKKSSMHNRRSKKK